MSKVARITQLLLQPFFALTQGNTKLPFNIACNSYMCATMTHQISLYCLSFSYHATEGYAKLYLESTCDVQWHMTRAASLQE